MFMKITAFIAISCITVSINAAPLEQAKHNISWNQLSRLQGKNSDEKVAVKLLAPALKKVLGRAYSTYKEYHQVSSGIRVINGNAVEWGMMAHSAGDQASYFIFNEAGSVLVILKNDKAMQYYGDRSLLNNAATRADAQENLFK